MSKITDEVTRPIIGIENRTGQEVFDIMADRFRALRSESEAVAWMHNLTGVIRTDKPAVSMGLHEDYTPLHPPRPATVVSEAMVERAMRAFVFTATPAVTDETYEQSKLEMTPADKLMAYNSMRAALVAALTEPK